MSLTINHVPVISHGLKWCSGYSIGTDCKSYHRTWFHKKGNGPRTGEKIILRNILSSNSNKIYVRFWTEDATSDTLLNEEPDIEYINGGMVGVNKKSQAVFRLCLPKTITTEEGKIPPHFYYRLCKDGLMSPVHTIYLTSRCSSNCNLMIMRGYLDNALSPIQNRLYSRELEEYPHNITDYNSNMCQTLTQTNCDPYQYFPGPVSGAVMGPSYMIQPMPL